MSNVVNHTKNGKCINCGECCTDMFPLSFKDYNIIVEYLKIHPEIKEQFIFTNNTLHMACAFRDDINKRCTIYEVRPTICRIFKCNQSLMQIDKNKTRLHKEAMFNYIDMKAGISRNLVTTHALFFGNLSYEQTVFKALAHGDKDAYDQIIKPFKYFKED